MCVCVGVRVLRRHKHQLCDSFEYEITSAKLLCCIPSREISLKPDRWLCGISPWMEDKKAVLMNDLRCETNNENTKLFSLHTIELLGWMLLELASLLCGAFALSRAKETSIKSLVSSIKATRKGFFSMLLAARGGQKSHEKASKSNGHSRLSPLPREVILYKRSHAHLFISERRNLWLWSSLASDFPAVCVGAQHVSKKMR